MAELACHVRSFVRLSVAHDAPRPYGRGARVSPADSSAADLVRVRVLLNLDLSWLRYSRLRNRDRQQSIA